MDKLLIKKAKEDVESLEILLNQFKPMILKAAVMYCYETDLFSDAISEGTLTLINCVRKYPLDSKIPFPYYAKRAVYSRIRFFASSEISRNYNIASLDEEVKGGEGITIEDTVSSDETLEDEFFKSFDTLRIISTIESLRDIEREVLQRHFFLGHNMNKIAKDLDYSYRGVRYARDRGIQILKERLSDM